MACSVTGVIPRDSKVARRSSTVRWFAQRRWKRFRVRPQGRELTLICPDLPKGLRTVCVRPDPRRSTRQTETCTPYRHTKCGRFVVLKHNLLSQHDIADWDILLR
jgi:hypothetical protein